MARRRPVCRLTLMRTPIVKRQTTPESGFFLFFSAVPRSGVVSSRCRVLTGFPSQVPTERGYTKHLLRFTHYFYGECRELLGLLCDLEIILYPRTVLFKGMAKRSALASSYQARERGSTRNLGRPIAICSRARASVQSKGQAQGYRA
jgi:hypothetical protein